MYKIIITHIAGCSFNNEDGSIREDILKSLVLDSDLHLQNYLFDNEKAVKVLTLDNKCVGNIPKDLSELIFDNNESGKIKKVVYKPNQVVNGRYKHYVKIYIQK